jgi:ATP-binding cassette subfamily C protein CydC
MINAVRRDPLLRLAPLALRQRRVFAAIVLTGVLAHLTAVAAGALGAYVVGSAVQSAHTGSAPPQLTTPIVLLVASLLGHGFFRWYEMWLAHDLAYRVIAELRVSLFDGLARLAPAWLHGRRTGDLAARVLADAEALEWFYAHTIAAVAIALLVPMSALVVLLAIAGPLALAILPFLLLLASLPWWRARHALTIGASLRHNSGELAADVVDGVQGLRELVVFGRDGAFADRIDERTDALHRWQRLDANRIGTEEALSDTVGSLMMVILLLAGAGAVAAGSLGAPLLPMVIVLAATAAVPVADLNSVTSAWGRLRACASRVREVLDTPERVRDRVGSAPTVPIMPTIEFDHVWFRYAETADWVLRSTSFRVEAGHTVAIVGPSGSGKTTCAQLLLRFWDTDSGAIRVGGHDIRDLPQDTLRSLITAVQQDIHLFATSVADNIRLGVPDATDHDVVKAATLAQADGFIRTLPDGYATVIGERGCTLSGGQRQRVALARAFLQQAPILLLDEAASQLDTANEAALQQTINQLSESSTVLVIAHRVSTIAAADHVLLLGDGAIQAAGTHLELLEKCPAYRDLLAEQIIN